MAFPREQPILAIGRGVATIVFHIPDPDDPEDAQSGHIIIMIKYSNGTADEKSFDLLLRLGDDTEGQTHLVNLASLKTYILARIENELLP